MAVCNHKPTAVIDNDPKNNEEKHKKDEPLYSRVDGQHNSAVTIGGGIVIKTSKT